MERDLQQDQRKPEKAKTGASVDLTATTPAMQALIDAASEAQSTEGSSLQVDRERLRHPSRKRPNTVSKTSGNASLPTTTASVDANQVKKINRSPSTTSHQGIKSTIDDSCLLANLDPNEHAKVSDPIVRPAKRNKKDGKGKIKIKNNNGDYSDGEGGSFEERTKTEPIGYSDSILSRLFEPDRKQKPKLWEFIRLVAPGPANQPPLGQYKWRSKDAIAAYCLKCKISFTYTPGTSKTVSRHLIAYHGLNDGKKIAASVKADTKKAECKQTKNSKQAFEKSRISNTKNLVESGSNSNSNHNNGGTNFPTDATSQVRLNEGDSELLKCQIIPAKKKVDQKLQKWQPKKGENDTNVPEARSQLEDLQEDTHKRDRKVLEFLSIDEDEDEDEDEEDAFLKGHGSNRKAIIAKALFRWWVGSYQSLYCHDSHAMLPKWDSTRSILSGRGSSLFVDFCKTLDNSFELPDHSVMDSMATTSYDRLQTEIKIHVSKLFRNESHEFVSASVRRIQVVNIINPETRANTSNDVDGRTTDTEFPNYSHNGRMQNLNKHPLRKMLVDEKDNDSQGGLLIRAKTFFPVRLTFCTPMFRMKSYVIAVIPGKSEVDKSEIDETIISPYSEAVDRALQIHRIPQDNVSRVVIRRAYQEELVSTSSNEFSCILDRLDGIIIRALRSPTILPPWIQELLGKQQVSHGENNHKLVQESASSIFCTIRTHEILLASLPPSEEMETPQNNNRDKRMQYNTIANILDIITPFRDAIQTLSEDLYPTVGLAIPVLRRVNTLLQTSALLITKAKLKSFLQSILEDFKKNFDSLLKTNPDLMWTVPLDPRLIAMRGLSGDEQIKAKSMLTIEVAKLVEVVDKKELDRKHKISPEDTSKLLPKTNRARYPLSSTMGGIFWGDSSYPTSSSGIDANSISSAVKDAKQHATRNVDSYFNTVHSQRQIKDPLLWWKNNQDQFPELAILARKWISASAVYGTKNTRENESVSVISTSSSDTETICRMIFLHDNNDIL